MTDLIEVHLANRTVSLTSSERDEWARRAIKVFQGMEYSMTAYARVLTGDPTVRLQMASGSAHTDGHTIYYRPPLSLGDPSPHVGGQCDRRDADGHLICPACAVREFALRQITHEVAHLVGGSFVNAGPMEQQRAVRLGITTARSDAARNFLTKRIDKVRWGQDISFVMKAMSPYLGMLLMMLEDARIDLKMFRSRQGTRKMFKSISKQALERGFTRLDGARVSWSEKPLNAQMMIGLLCKAEGFDYSALHEKVVTDLDDPILTDIAAQIDRTGGPTDIASLAIQALVRLWELGYCDPPEDIPPPPEPEPEEEPDDAEVPEDPGSEGEPEGDGESSESDPGSSGDSGKSDSGESADDSDRDSDTEEGDSGPGSPGVSEPGDDGSGSEQADQSDSEPGEESDDPGQGNSTSSDNPSASGSSGGGDSDGGPSDGGAVAECGPGDSEDAESESVPTATEPGMEDGPTGGESSGDLESGSDEDNSTPGAEPPGVDRDSGGEEFDESFDGSSLGSSGDEVHPEDEASDPPGGDDDARSDDSSSSGPGGSPDEDPGDPLDEYAVDDNQREESESPSSEQLPEDLHETESGDAGSNGGDLDSSEDERTDETSDKHSESGDAGSAASYEGSSGQSGDVSTPDEADEPSGGDNELGGDLNTGADAEQSEDLPDAGSPEDVVDLIQDFTGHNHDDDEIEATVGPKSDTDDAAVDKAIVQASHFDNPTATVYDIRVFTWPKDDRLSSGWRSHYSNDNLTLRISDRNFHGRDLWETLTTPEEVLQPALFEMRRVFSDNRRSRYDRNLKRGKLDARSLGRRAWKAEDDPRLFKKIERPGKRSYSVIIAGDASTSAHGGPIVVEKQAMLAQAELCHRMGINFEVWFHTADEYEGPLRPKGFDRDEDDAWTQDMYRVKEWNEPWNDKAREGIAWMRPVYTNLDGHNLEFLRKRLMAPQDSTKILLYYTDGEMPAANYDDELETLKREIDIYKRAGIIMLGIGVGTSSPSKWGMDTVRIDNKGDIGKVIKHLERRLITA